MSDEEETRDEDCSDVDFVFTDNSVPTGDCESDDCLGITSSEEIDEDHSTGENRLVSSQRVRVPVTKDDNFSSDYKIPLSQLQTRIQSYFGKNLFRWSSVPSAIRTSTQQYNIVSQAPGLKPQYRDVFNKSITPLDLWSLLFTNEMLDKIVLHTNRTIRQLQQTYKNKDAFKI
ncbi:unnamed protein product [Parnassius apollo]|uniref:(apollo) hypothetical protein n=1 Tax=Parnassius apollo TaxID=110799 RepID=A0A8S3Y2M7_PARAO|nr:unnamed protein product [Parnassius apollo]